MKVLEVIARDQLTKCAAELGQHLVNGLKAIQTRHECVGDVRGRGLLRGMEIRGLRVRARLIKRLMLPRPSSASMKTGRPDFLVIGVYSHLQVSFNIHACTIHSGRIEG